LYGEYARPSGPLYSSVGSIQITDPGTEFYFITERTLSLSVPPAGGVRATATCAIVNGVPNSVTITNPGVGYITAPNILISVGGGGTGVSPTRTTTLNLDRKGSMSGIWKIALNWMRMV